MTKRRILVILLVLTLIITLIILIIKSNTRYNKLVVDDKTWDSLINSRNLSNNINLESIKFNDYSLIVDEENNIIYYSVVDSSRKDNPLASYIANDKKVKLVINKKINDELLENTDKIKIMIYNDNEYKIYSLVVTNYSLININYEESSNIKNNFSADIEVFANHEDAIQRVIKSKGKFKIINDNSEYRISLSKESLGHKTRDNIISLLGMEKVNEYIITKEINNSDERVVRLFINNKYMGLYTISPNEKRRIDNYERNRRVNK